MRLTSIFLAFLYLAGAAAAGNLPTPVVNQSSAAQTNERTTGILPVVGSTEGAFGSKWKTEVQLVNAHLTKTSAGRLVFRRSGVEASNSDPGIPFSIAPGGSKIFPDIVAAIGQTGLGSLDIVVDSEIAPQVSARVLNDAGSTGAYGFVEDLIDPEASEIGCWGGPSYYPGTAVLADGISGFLITPDSSQARFNVGVRSLANGATLVATLRDSLGGILQTITREYGPNYFEQRSAEQFLGVPVGVNQSIRLAVTQGTAIIYGSATDNHTNDASIQRTEGTLHDSRDFSEWYPPPWGARRIVPLVGQPAGTADTEWSTAVQLFNPHDALAATGKLVFHRAGVQGAIGDPSVSYELAPGETRLIDDVVAASGATGWGSLEMISAPGSPVPILAARLYTAAPGGGTQGVMLEAVDPEAWPESACSTANGWFAAPILDRGLGGMLVAPAEPENSRVSIGFSTDRVPARITLAALDKMGQAVKTVIRDVPPFSAEQVGAEDLFGGQLEAGQPIRIYLEEGTAIVYAVTADVRSGDVSVQYARGTLCRYCRD